METTTTLVDTYSNDYKGEHVHQKSLSDLAKQLTIGSNRVKLGDVFTNTQLDLGFGTNDPAIEALYPQARTLTWNLQRIEAIMRADPFFVRALEYRSTKPIIKGIDISSSEIEAERIQEFYKQVNTKLHPGMREAIFEADAFGWSGALVVIDGHMNKRKLQTPLRPEEIRRGKFLGLKPLTRWYQINPSGEMITKLGKESEIYDPRDLGTPLYYNVSFDGDKGNMYKVHRSRLLITSRNRLSYIEKKVEHYGGTSLLEQAFESLSRYHALVAQIHRILQKSVIPVLKMEELASSALQTKAGQKLVEKKIEMMRQNLSSNNLFVIGEGDDISFEEASIVGLAEQLKQARLQLAAALNTPPSILFHEMQGGESDQEYYDFIRHRQEFMVRPMYDKLLDILYRSEYGTAIPEYSISFKPLEDPTLEQIAKARKTNVEAIDLLYRMGVLNKKTVMDSLSDIDSNPTDIFRNLDPEYYSFVEGLGTEEGYHTDEIRLAQALNQGGDGYMETKQGGRINGGDPETSSKPTPDLPVNKERKEG